MAKIRDTLKFTKSPAEKPGLAASNSEIPESLWLFDLPEKVAALRPPFTPEGYATLYLSSTG